MSISARYILNWCLVECRLLLGMPRGSPHKEVEIRTKQPQMSSLSVLEGHKVQELPIFTKNKIIIVRISIKKKLESYSFF